MPTIDKQLKDNLTKEVESLLKPRDYLRLGLGAVCVVSAVSCGGAIMGMSPFQISEQAFNHLQWLAFGTGAFALASGFSAHFIGKKNERIRELLRGLE
jgi:hypothetical protein